MFNSYMPPNGVFRPVPPEEDPPPCDEVREDVPQTPPPRQKPPGSDLLGELTGGVSKALSGIFKDFSLKNLDSGDILLLLILLFLFLEGDNLDLVIALGLMLLLGLGSTQPEA